MDAHTDVFRSLREIFPQVDVRVLRAVAIEHYGDVDSAVDFILDEVMPSISGSVGTSSARGDALETGSSSSAGRALHVNEVNGSVHFEQNTSSAEVISGSQENIVGGPDRGGSPLLQDVNEKLDLSSHPVQEFKENHGVASDRDDRCLNLHSESKLGHPDTAAGYGGYISEEFLAPSYVEKIGADSINLNIPQLNELHSNIIFSAGDNTAQNHSLKFPRDYHESGEMDMKNVNSAFPFLFLADTSGQDLFSPDLGESFVGCPGVVLEQEDINNAGSDCDKQRSGNVVEHDGIVFSSETDIVPNHDLNQLAPATSSHSGHSLSVESLEDSIADAKSNKNDLLPSLELVTKMIDEVELLEEKAKVAKHESSAAGRGILTRVEELKEMLNHAKEANDMHAGEVSGEKSILATEAQELHSRLHRLSHERNRYLKIIEEIRQALEERLAIAQEEIEAAEKERIGKEALAQALLNEQEIMMNVIIEESRKLQQEAEDNLKLKDFLVERGRIVDALQGEMAVICEDVSLLKEIVDECLPLSKLQRSTMSSLSSSLHSSLNKSESSSDRIIGTVEATDKHTVAKGACQEVEEQDSNKMTDIAGCQRRDSNEDGWEFC